jgi:hypothetical protein
MTPDIGAFNPVIPSPTWDGLENLSEHPMDVLAKFVHGCSKDPATRTAAVTLFVTSLCQLAGKGMTARMPSTLVINAHDMVPDGTDLLTSLLVANPVDSGPRVHREGYFMHGTPEQAPRAMANAIVQKQELGTVTAYNASIHRDLEERYFAAQRTGFGHGPTRGYAEAWHGVFHLITDQDDQVILRIATAQDRAAFYKHVMEGDKRLRQPVGYGADLKLVSKSIALSGSIPASQWDARLANGIIDLGLPLLMLPSVAKTPPEIPNEKVFDFITTVLPRTFSDRVEEPANLIPNPWFEAYGRELRARLQHLPGDYEYSMQKMARQLFPICLRIANWCGTHLSVRAGGLIRRICTSVFPSQNRWNTVTCVGSPGCLRSFCTC